MGVLIPRGAKNFMKYGTQGRGRSIGADMKRALMMKVRMRQNLSALSARS
jgi:hypothetical protein